MRWPPPLRRVQALANVSIGLVTLPLPSSAVTSQTRWITKVGCPQELVSRKDQPALRAEPARFEPQLDFVHASALAAAFKRSDIHAAVREELGKPYGRARCHPAALMKSKYGLQHTRVPSDGAQT
jgi:hypothetical protein